MVPTPAGRVLMLGDIELQGQSQLLALDADLRVDVFKISHHGSRYITPQFLHVVRPRLTLISIGLGNSYGHLSPLILHALTRSGTRVLSTEQRGDIAVLPGAQGIRTAIRGALMREGTS